MKKYLGLILVWAGIVSGLWAEDAPRIFTYTGKYVSSDGTPMPDGVYDLLFALYATPVDGAPVWTELHRNADKNGVQVSKGKFEVVLGNLVPLPEFEKNYWIGVSHPATGQQLVPREQLASVPYALNGVPKGAIIIWRGATCPIGYRKVNEFDGRFLRGCLTEEPIGATGGEETADHKIAKGEHSHSFTTGSPNGNCLNEYGFNMGYPRLANESHTHSGSTSGPNDGAHTHSFPPYINVIFCEKE